MDNLKKGLNGTTLKILALLLMTIDHIAYFVLPYTGLPFQVGVGLHWIGRIAAPIFIFMVAEGFYHTRNRKKYIVRLYGWSVLMGLGNELLNTVLPHPEGAIIFNNIFATMCVITVYLMMIEWIRKGIREKQVKWVVLGIVGMCVPIILTAVTFGVMEMGYTVLLRWMMFFVPTPMFVEGGIIWVILGIGLYLCRRSKKRLGIFYCLFCAMYFYMMAGAGITYENLFLLNYQWMMVFALPLILLYNGQKGKSMKYLFYVYYPVHCYVLYAVGVWVAINQG